MASWNDYNDATQNPNLMPKGTIVRVRLTIRPGVATDRCEGKGSADPTLLPFVDAPRLPEIRGHLSPDLRVE